MTNKLVIEKDQVNVVELEGSELQEYNDRITALETSKQEEETAKETKATNQASGNQKLLDLGLTQAEATALTGYTPPVEE